MRGNYFFFVGVIAVVLLVIMYSFSGSQVNEDYLQEIQEYRNKKNRNFKKPEETPFSKKDLALFDSLSYFPPNPAYRIEAKVIPYQIRETIKIQTSQELTREYLKFARASFSLEGKEHELLILKMLKTPLKQAEDYLFVAFTDETSGRTTYGAGRYLDIEPDQYQPTLGKIVLDFNLAYNPYCAYNDIYDCPLPPSENHLPIAIEAGEKNYLRPTGKE